MESGFSSSPRAEAFPAGLRVLVVDDDLTWLKILEKMLKKCSYNVTTCGLASEALKLLRERKDGFDIVISDVNMPDMDGFKLLELVGLEMDLPVIMMSVDGETSRVMKGVQHGACDYLLKPIRMKELKNIWQHVLRKRMRELRSVESREAIDDFQVFKNGNEHLDDRNGGDQTLGRRRKDAEYTHGDKDGADTCSAKRPRVVWSVDLHQRFVKAVNQIGIDKVGPKKILDLMNVPWLTRENVASHLQKYRLYLSRLQNENEMKPCEGIMSLDNSSNDSSGRFGPQSSTSVQQSYTYGTGTKFTSPANKLLYQAIHSDSHQVDQRGISLLPSVDHTKSFNTSISASRKPSRSPTISSHGGGSLESGIHLAQFGSLGHDKCGMVGTVSELQFQCHGQLGDLNHGDFQVSRQTIQADLLQSGLGTCPDRSINESQRVGMMQTESSDSKHVFQDIKVLPNHDSSIGLSNSQALEPFANTRFDMDHTASQNSMVSEGCHRKNPVSEFDSAVGSLNEDMRYSWPQGDNFMASLGYDSLASPEMINEVPINLYGALKFDFEYPSDTVKYSVS